MRFAVRSFVRVAPASLIIWIALSSAYAQASRVQQTGGVDRLDVTDYGIYTAEKSEVTTKGKNSRHYAVENVAIVAMTAPFKPCPT